jgi:Tfp pilus assembly protein PilZ
MVIVRLSLALSQRSDWVKVFDPMNGDLFVPTEEPPEAGTEVRIDLVVAPGGPRVILAGSVLWSRAEGDDKNPIGCCVSLAATEREKINFLNGYVRGGILNRREKRRLPLRLSVTFGGLSGPVDTVTRDISDEGIFLITDSPLPEGTVVHFVVMPPGLAPLDVKGIVSHTVLVTDEDTPGMGIRFTLDLARQNELTAAIDKLESAFMRGSLPEDVLA